MTASSGSALQQLQAKFADILLIELQRQDVSDASAWSNMLYPALGIHNGAAVVFAFSQMGLHDRVVLAIVETIMRISAMDTGPTGVQGLPSAWNLALAGNNLDDRVTSSLCLLLRSCGQFVRIDLTGNKFSPVGTSRIRETVDMLVKQPVVLLDMAIDPPSSWHLLQYDLGTAPRTQESAELWSPDVLCEIFLSLPLDRRTLLAVSQVCHAWEFYSNYLPHWGVLFDEGLEGRTREEVAAVRYRALAPKTHVTPLCDCLAHWPTALEVLFCFPFHMFLPFTAEHGYSLNTFNWLDRKEHEDYRHKSLAAGEKNYCIAGDVADLVCLSLYFCPPALFTACTLGGFVTCIVCNGWHGARPEAPRSHTCFCLPLRMCQVYRQHNLVGKAHFMCCVRKKYQLALPWKEPLHLPPSKQSERMS